MKKQIEEEIRHKKRQKSKISNKITVQFNLNQKW